MPRTRVKICGITRAEDAIAAAECGADAIGLVFCAKSPRNVDLDTAAALRRAVPAFVTVTALFVDPDPDLVNAVDERVQPDLHQFHGGESAAFCAGFGRPWIRAVPMAGGADPQALMAEHAGAAGFVLDSHSAGGLGGSGLRFDWAAAEGLEGRLIVAGGLSADNVGAAIARLRPWAVDVSSGVEDAPGIKSAARMRDFLAEVGRSDRG